MKAVNLLPSDLRSAPKRSKGTKGTPGVPASERAGGLGPYVVLGALALAVVMLAGWVLETNKVKDRTAELAQVTANADAAKAKAAELKPYGDFQALAQQRVATVQQLANARFDWEKALRDLSHALPADVTLQSLNGSVNGASGGSSFRGQIAAPAIELKGCTAGQTEVARLMSRMRNVRGVTRVSLVKSDKEASASTGGAESGPCGKGAKPSFEMVVFFESATDKSQVPGVAAAAGSAAAAPAATPAAGAAPAAGQPSAAATPAATPAAGASTSPSTTTTTTP